MRQRRLRKSWRKRKKLSNSYHKKGCPEADIPFSFWNWFYRVELMIRIISATRFSMVCSAFVRS